MPNKIILKKSSVSGKIPTADDLAYGELAINYTDGLLYYKHSSNDIRAFTGGQDGVSQKHTAIIGNGIDTVFEINYNFADPAVIVQVLEISSNKLVEVGVEITTPNLVKIFFAYPPPVDSYKVIIIG